MQKVIYQNIVLLALLCTVQSIWAGGGWPQPKGLGYFKLSQSYLRADQHFTNLSDLDDNVTFGFYQTSLYGEYGITDRFDVLWNAPLFTRATVDNIVSLATDEILVAGDALNGLGDIDLGLKYGLTKRDSRVAVAATLWLGIPSGNELGGAEENLQLGDGEFNQLLQIDAGVGLGQGYMNVYGGFNNRTNGFSDEIRLGVEYGHQVISQKLWLSLRVDVLESLKNSDFNQLGEFSCGVLCNDREYISPMVSANYYITDEWGISGTVGGAVRGELILAAPMYSIGVFYDMN